MPHSLPITGAFRDGAMELVAARYRPERVVYRTLREGQALLIDALR
jgi:hypothetical protein